jgi:carboxypeptidase C (cathepsin A)
MAADTVAAIVGWFEKFPEFKTNDLWISGESYGGMYVPFTANAVHHHNAVHSRDPTIFKPNLKGFMVGNGCTDWKYDTEAAYYEMGSYHSLYPMEVWEGMQKDNCLDEYYNENWKGMNVSAVCKGYRDIFDDATKRVNVYNIEGNCWGLNKTESKYGFTKARNNFEIFRKYNSYQDYTPFLSKVKREKL